MKTCLYFLAWFILHVLISAGVCYGHVRCPSQSEWPFRSSWFCNGTETQKYACLFNALKLDYEESCKFQPSLSGNGVQYVIHVYPNPEPCRKHGSYQPFSLGSNVSSNCVFHKSTCTEEGQVLFRPGSNSEDLTCRCDFEQGFGFVGETKNTCDCSPSKEDCSCYLKKGQCKPKHLFLADYKCLHEDNKKHIVECPQMRPDSSSNETPPLREISEKELYNIDYVGRRSSVIVLSYIIAAFILIGLCAFLCIIINTIYDCCAIPIRPYNLKVNLEGDFVRLSWLISDKVRNDDIQNYKIYNTFNNSWNATKPILVKKEKFYLLTPLLPRKTYRFKVSVCLKSRGGESKCSEEETFNTGLPSQPQSFKICGENKKLLLLWEPPKTNLIVLEYYSLKISTDDWASSKDIHLDNNVLKYEIKDTEEDMDYRFELVACSNSVNSLPSNKTFHTRHGTYGAGVVYATDSLTEDIKEFVKDEVVKEVVKVCNGLPGDQKLLETSASDGSIVVKFSFVSKDFNKKEVLHETLKNALQKGMIGPLTVHFKKFWLERFNDPLPPQLVKASNIGNGVFVSWNEPVCTFFETKEYVVEYTKDDWISKEEIIIPVDVNSCFIGWVLPCTKIQVKVYTCVCHSIRSSPSLEVSTVVKANCISPYDSTAASDQQNVQTGYIEIKIVKGQLAKMQVDAIVNTTSKELKLDHGTVSASLLKHGGSSLQQQCSQNYPHGINYGDIAVTSGGNLKCKIVCHGCLNQWREDGSEIKELDKFVKKCMSIASKTECRSIAFPALGTGKLRYPAGLVAKSLYQCVEEISLRNRYPMIKEVLFVVYDKDHDTVKAFETEENHRKKISAVKNTDRLLKGEVSSIVFSRMSDDEKCEVIRTAIAATPHFGEELKEAKEKMKKKDEELDQLQKKVLNRQLLMKGEKEALEGNKVVYFDLYPERAYKEGSVAQTHFRLAESQFYRLISGNGNSFTVNKVQYVVNPPLVKHFHKAIDDMKNRRGAKMANPILAFHGTQEANIKSIVENNFKVQGQQGFAHRHDTGYYERGVYFSEYPGYSMSYISGATQLLLCQILPGNVYVCPTVIQGASLKQGHDSHMSADKKEIVIFNSHHILPFYIVHYTTGGFAYQQKKY